MRLRYFVTAIILLCLVGYKFLRAVLIDRDGSTIPQIVTLAGVRKTMIRIADTERKHIVYNAGCVSLDELISAGEIQEGDNKRSGYSFTIECSGLNYTVTGRRPLAPGGFPHGFPSLAIDQTMAFHEIN